MRSVSSVLGPRFTRRPLPAVAIAAGVTIPTISTMKSALAILKGIPGVQVRAIRICMGAMLSCFKLLCYHVINDTLRRRGGGITTSVVGTSRRPHPRHRFNIVSPRCAGPKLHKKLKHLILFSEVQR